MAQFAVHALIGLWITWSLPSFNPYLLRFSFGFGLYVGSVMPDVDLYASAIAFFLSPSSFLSFHRSLTHSILFSSLLLFLFLLIDSILSVCKNHSVAPSHFIYEVEGGMLDEESLLALHGTLPFHEGHVAINFKAFGLGLYAGMLIHVLLDVVFWFSPIDLLYPLPLFHIGKVVDAWQIEVPELISTILTLSELFMFALFFTILRVSVARRLGKWAYATTDLTAKKRAFTDNDIEHTSMDFSLHSDNDICPIDPATLARARPALLICKVLLIFQFLYFFAACVVPFICKEYLEFVVFGEMMIICIPAFCYLSWTLRDVIIKFY